MAANGCEIVRGDATTRIIGFEPLPTAEGIAAFTPSQQFALGTLKRTKFVKLIAADAMV